VGLGLHDLVERERLVKVAFCFPGQGSQDVGMGQEMAGAFPEAQAVYDEAADAVGFDIARICFEGPIEELTRTEIQQPALVTTSLACLRAVETRGISADVVVGHSVGEYSALGAAGALADREAVALVRERGEATAAAAGEHPGAMAAIIGLEDSVVEELCRSIEDVWPANYNCPGQLVVSGEPGAVDRLLAEAATHGARKTVKLRVGGAFHSPLVGSAGERLRPAVEAVSWQEPLPPFMSTVSAQIESADRLGELLVQQLTAPVRFTQAVATLVQGGVDTFVEIGPGQVLSGLVRRCDRSLRTISVGDPASLQKLEETLSAA
jgi:[acyl-carrier-protein] S-malonyltransferase